MTTKNVNAQCPTVPTTIQLCDSDTPRVVDLVATDNGGGVVWYENNTGGTPLTGNEILSDGTTYYADDTAGSCPNRQPQQVNINGQPPSNVDIAISRCSSSTNTIGSLNATGTNIEWYSEQNGGVLLAGSTNLVDGETYWVQQTEIGCVSNRLPTSVTIIDPGPPTGDAEQFFCIDPVVPVVYRVADLTANGTDIIWYSSATSNTALDSSTPLVADQTYYATQTTFPCESTGRFASTVRFTDANDPGDDVTLVYCDDETTSITLLNELGGTPDNGGVWTGPVATSGADQGILDLSLLNAGSFVFTYTLSVNNACPEESSMVTINIQVEPNAGDDATLDICSSNASVDLFTILGSTPDAGGTWSPALASGTGVFDPSLDSGGVYTYTVAPTAPCSVSDSATVTVNLDQVPDAGDDAILDICENDVAVDLFVLLGVDAISGGVWSPTLTSGTGVFDPAVDPEGIYTYTLAATANCPGDESQVNVTVDSQLSAGTGGSTSFCTNDSSVDLFTILTNSPNTGGVWSPALTSGTGVFNPAVDIAGDYTYTVGGTGACSSDSATITVILNITPNAGNDNTINFCGDSASVNLFSLLGSSADSGGTWSGPTSLANGDAGTFNPTANTPGQYIYTVTGVGACDDAIATIDVTISDLLPDLPVDGNEFCFLDNPTVSDLIARILPENGGILTVYDSPMGMTTVPSTDLLLDDTSYFITETDIATSCEGTQRLVVFVNINNPDTPVLSAANASFCLIDTPTISELNAFLLVGSNVIWIDAVSGTEFTDSDELLAGNYYGVEEDMNGCRSTNSSTISIEINDDLPPTLIANGNEFCGVDNPTIADLEANLNIGPGLAAVWYDEQVGGNSLSTSDMLEHNGVYYVASLNNSTGCESSTRTQIVTDLTICDPDIYPLLIPDGFSPNGDGINDTFLLENVEFIYEDYTIEIYNRYGSIVYRGDNSSNPWDGRANISGLTGNGVLPNGVYFYIINYNRNNTQPIQGTIYLNR